VVFGVEVAWS